MNIKKYMSVALAGVMALSIAGCNIIERTPESIGKTVYAKVDGDKITKDDLDKEMKAVLQQYKSYFGDDYESNAEAKDGLKEQKQQYLDMLVETKILTKAADELGVTPSDDEIDSFVQEQVDKYKQYNNNDQEQFEQYLDSIGYTEDSLKEYLKTQYIAQAAVDKIVEDVDASEDEAKEYYNNNIDSYEEKPGAYVTHIVLSGDDAEAKAKKAQEYAKQGKSLEDISKMDEFKDVCKYEDLGYQAYENSGLVAEFVTAFKALPANQVSDPVKTSYGWHIIYNTRVNAEGKTPEFEEIKDQVKETVLGTKKQSKYKDAIEEYKDKYKVETYEDKL